MLLPDRGPDAARRALAAAAAVRVFDGRATAWLVVARATEVPVLALLVVAMVDPDRLAGPWFWWALGVLVLVAIAQPLGRVAGAEPRLLTTRRRVALTSVGILLVVLVGRLDASSDREGPPVRVHLVAALGLGCYVLAPAVRWARNRLTHGRGPEPGWPEGAEAFAVLSVLAQARRVHPARLCALTGLLPVRCDEWVEACTRRGLALRGSRRTLFPRGSEITPLGLRRLEEWTAELEARAGGAQPWTSSTAPTSPADSTSRSSSEVT